MKGLFTKVQTMAILILSILFRKLLSDLAHHLFLASAPGWGGRMSMYLGFCYDIYAEAGADVFGKLNGPGISLVVRVELCNSHNIL